MKVIVVGGGVAGAAGAIALRRIGAEVTVYEAYEDPAGQVGSFLSLASNGLRVLDELGCLEEVQRSGFDVARQRMWGSSGKLLGDVPRGRLTADPLHSVTLMRADLVAVLRARAARSGARIVTGERLVGAVTTQDGVRAEFASGRVAEADLLIGADGIWSTTRTVLDPSAPAPAYAGLYSISGVAENVGVEQGTFNMVFARNGAFIHLPAPDGSLWWSAQVAAAERPELNGVGDAEWLDRLSDLYRFEELPQAILKATTSVHRPTPMHVLPEVPVRHNDRIALVGDAGHPVGAGQGASMAIEDALVLAQTVAGTATIADGLRRYDQRRRARIAKLVRSAASNRDAKTAGPIARRLNDLIMPIFFRHFYEKATGWLYSHDLGTLSTPTEAPVRGRESGGRSTRPAF
ncbi:FAD-dependent monooxygenase [Actinomadura sp. 1N219]|uniref:FAD-dependent monooxygenase n=1 Tax=Actinomadura sp. 1N219 TaxID=3375152 RepID=UPI00379B6976